MPVALVLLGLYDAGLSLGETVLSFQGKTPKFT